MIKTENRLLSHYRSLACCRAYLKTPRCESCSQVGGGFGTMRIDLEEQMSAGVANVRFNTGVPLFLLWLFGLRPLAFNFS